VRKIACGNREGQGKAVGQATKDLTSNGGGAASRAHQKTCRQTKVEKLRVAGGDGKKGLPLDKKVERGSESKSIRIQRTGWPYRRLGRRRQTERRTGVVAETRKKGEGRVASWQQQESGRSVDSRTARELKPLPFVFSRIEGLVQKGGDTESVNLELGKHFPCSGDASPWGSRTNTENGRRKGTVSVLGPE